MRASRNAVVVPIVLAIVTLVAVREYGRSHARGTPAAASMDTTSRGAAPVSAAPADTDQSPTITTSGPVSVRRSAEPAPARDDDAIRDLLRDGAAGTYIRDILQQQDGMLMRWPDHRLDALRIWIEPSSALSDFNPAYPVVVEHAFDEWSNAGFPLRFDVVRDSTGANIQIVWIQQLEAGTSRIGVTRKTRDQNGWILDAQISIALHDPDGHALSPDLVAGVARHEIGHALGLAHSSNPADVMYPESRSTTITAADRATVHLLYLLPPGVVK